MQNLKQIGLFVRTNLWIVPLALLLVWLLFRFLDPAPPKVLVMTTGSESGSYHQFGLAMQQELAKQNLELQLRPSRGSLDNLQRLTDGSGEVQLGLIQSGTEQLLAPAQRSQLMGLAALYHEPLWLFQRQDVNITQLSDLQDKRVAVGSEGSGTWAVLKGLFEQRQDGARLELLNNGLWRKMGSAAAADALLAGELDAAFLVLPADNRLVTRLAANPEVSLVNLAQADAYAARLHFLEALELPRGLLNITASMPPQDTKLLSPVAMLVGNQDFHPALTAVVLEAARKVLREGNLLDKPGRFPAGEPMGLELSKEADYYHRQGMPFLQRYLPFQVASAIDRYVVLIIPFIAIMFPLLKTMGPLYRWRVRARVYRWYEHLRRIDKLIYSGKIKQQYAEQIQGLKALESELNHVDVPLSYAHELYSLHLHVRYMIYRLETLQAEEEGGEKPSPA
ncbi:TAXI family TRAP transporter solute-binding subunit [Halopseudomonas maritima]|uniref:TAXI family TRAP transporter solute-binding subunit n=1 Tax=Halopseudomonas maritima TaxID=2918528 RepID=UPI001EEC91AF|nr:TAXI family TRAP transporter solute-binding subunit [Halopseudomonas maritima]UJJ31305.1 ABC transporter substrate-binding protein [Halopseudomonas maritima]